MSEEIHQRHCNNSENIKSVDLLSFTIEHVNQIAINGNIDTSRMCCHGITECNTDSPSCSSHVEIQCTQEKNITESPRFSCEDKFVDKEMKDCQQDSRSLYVVSKPVEYYHNFKLILDKLDH